MRSIVMAIFLSALVMGCAVRPDRALPTNALLRRTTAEPPADDAAWRAVAFARAQIGKRYCWGGRGPNCFDCSGLAQAAWSHAGARIPRTSEDIAKTLPEVELEDVRAGDILWWPGHVGIYVGNGWVVDALNQRSGVVERPAKDAYRAYRPLAHSS